MTSYDQIIQPLRTFYDKDAARRDKKTLPAWKQRERQYFLERLQKENKKSLLEIGAGTGHDSLFFQQNGLTVISTDLTQAMVELCHNKGIEAYVMDFHHLAFPDNHFDAVFALNCLLHVPKPDLPAVLVNIRRLLKPGGLFFMGVHGGIEMAGTWEEDLHEPKRFFALYTDDQILAVGRQVFQLERFQPVQTSSEQTHFQSMIWRAPMQPDESIIRNDR